MHSYIALAVVCLAATSVHAGELLPVQAGSIDLGSFHGVVYYTNEADGYRVVATMAEGDAGPPVRFVATLADGQSLTISVPGKVGEPDRELEVSRAGEKLVVSGPSSADTGRNIRLQALGK